MEAPPDSSGEILEAACNESIPGLTGVSNFTVFLYCKLFEGDNESVDPAVFQMGVDLRYTCSDAAWYLSAAEEDFFWIQVCREFFSYEFNSTVCANSSFWLRRGQQVIGQNRIGPLPNCYTITSTDGGFYTFQAELEKDLVNHTSLEELCMQVSGETTGNSVPNRNCIKGFANGSLSARTFRHCFLPNNSALIAALCGKEPSDTYGSSSQDSWAGTFCSKVHNASNVNATEDNCYYRHWDVRDFSNASLLAQCEQTHGLREYICLNATLHTQLVESAPQLADVCVDLDARKCLLQRIFDMLPAPYKFDTSQLCVDPAPLLAEAVHKLSVCEVEGSEREGLLVMMGYVLRVLDFVIGLSSGLEEGEREARQGLGQAILLSSLLDNSSWATLQPQASVSVLQTVGMFLRREQNSTLKEDLLSCFSVSQQNANNVTSRSNKEKNLMLDWFSLLPSPSCGNSSSKTITHPP